MLLLEKCEHSFVDIERVPDPKRAVVLDGCVDGMVEATLDVFDRFADISNGRMALVGEFEAGEGSLENLDAPAFLERFDFPADVRVTGVEPSSCPRQTALFRKHKSAHQSFGGNMG